MTMQLAIRDRVPRVGRSVRRRDYERLTERIRAVPGRVVRHEGGSDMRVQQILATFDASPEGAQVAVGSPVFIDMVVDGLRSSRTTTSRAAAHDDLIDPMSERELEILDRLLEGFSYREMADQLFISRNTVKTHVRHVYTKLGVASREAAVDEVRRLGIA